LENKKHELKKLNNISIMVTEKDW